MKGGAIEFLTKPFRDRRNLMRKMSVRSLPELGQMADKLKLVSEKT